MARTPRIPSPPSSSDESNSAPPPAKKSRRGRNVSPDETPLPPRTKRSSEKKATNEKESHDALQAKYDKLRKQVQKQKGSAAAASTKNTKAGDDDNDLESEEKMSDVEEVQGGFSSAITPRGPLPLPPARPKTILRKADVKSTAPKPVARVFIRLPEPTAEERALDAQPSRSPSPSAADMVSGDENSALAVPPSPLPRSSSPSGPSSEHAGSDLPTLPSPKRSRPADSTPPPPLKRAKIKLEAKFAEGFVAGVAGAKPKASDYTSVPHSLILRSCADYSARILAKNPFPGAGLQTQWSHEVFRGACRSAGGDRYFLTDRMVKIIAARGSQVRGKIVEKYRALFASHFGFERSSSKKVINANKTKSEDLKYKGSFHYRNTKTRQGFGENKILVAARRLTTFRDAVSFGVLFPTLFNPFSLPYIAFDFCVFEFCCEEWSTGSFIQGLFTERLVAAKYRAHLADVEKWNALNPTVVENIRRTWYKRASQTLVPSALQTAPSTNIDENEEDALRNELDGRTGDTDEDEDEDDAEAAEV
ncbi:hypothetical protein B0H16DRAFT_1897093 [Mycena metata]|uniref:DUF6532 domain-containing protein n=1 Tax=Mycena metata TaxID=1033252 RepID=A0AAD7HGK1_9AGAR|nr:hypothetical protein B0H16DRAFT_1897093 [Mycena metata]